MGTTLSYIAKRLRVPVIQDNGSANLTHYNEPPSLKTHRESSRIFLPLILPCEAASGLFGGGANLYTLATLWASDAIGSEPTGEVDGTSNDGSTSGEAFVSIAVR